jgi:cytochrome c55X
MAGLTGIPVVLDMSKKLSNNSLRCLLICALAPLLVHCGLAWGGAAAEPAPARQAELLNLVRQDCGSCHGLRLEGGLGLPLTPQALKERPPEALKETVLHGRNGTAMPPWNPFLSEAEAEWIVQMLLKGLP